MSSPARKEPDDMAELEEIVGRFADEFALARAYKDVVRDAWEWFGSPAHFICADRCRFHLATLVGPYMVSTVGELVLNREKPEFEDVGFGRKYETMVFETTGKRCNAKGCGCGMPEIIPSEIDAEGYNDAGAATRGHMALCEKWSRRIAARAATTKEAE